MNGVKIVIITLHVIDYDLVRVSVGVWIRVEHCKIELNTPPPPQPK